MILAAAFAALVVSIIAFKRYLPYTGAPVLPKTPPAVVAVMDDVYLVGLGERGKLWSVKADKLEISQTRTIAVLKNINRAQVFDQGQAIISARAGKAVYDSVFEGLTLSDGVAVTAKAGKLTTSGAVWESETAMLRSIGPIQLETDWGKLTADGLILDARKEQLMLRKARWVIDLANIQGKTNSLEGLRRES